MGKMRSKKLSKMSGNLQAGNLLNNKYYTLLFLSRGSTPNLTCTKLYAGTVPPLLYCTSLLLPPLGTKSIISNNSLQLRKLYPSSWTTASMWSWRGPYYPTREL